MISKLKISNYQSHKDSDLEFVPGVNVIVGASDCGKTSIIRALRWLIWNKPGGDAFRSSWGGKTAVSVGVDGFTVTREKDKENLYQVEEEDRDIEPSIHKAFGTGVPEEIANLLNMDETNIQQQLDAPFLISSSAGEVAAFFNRIAHLDQIDQGLKTVQGEIRSIEGNIKADESRITEQKEALKKYDHLTMVETELEILEDIAEDRLIKVKSRAKLQSLLSGVLEINEELAKLAQITQLEQQVGSILALHEKRREIKGNRATLQDLTDSIGKDKLEIAYLSNFIFLEDLVDSTLSKIQQRGIIEGKRTELASLVEDVEILDRNIKRKEESIQGMTKEFEENMPDICPLCNTDLS